MAAPALMLVPLPSLKERVLEVERLASTVEALDDAGDLTPENYEALQAELCSAIAGTREKVDRTAAVLAYFEAAALAARAERDRLASRAQYFERQTARLEAYVLAVLDASKLAKIDGVTSTLAKRFNPESVVIEDGTVLAPEFLRVPPPPAPSPDKTAIKAAIKAGVAVPGCSLERGVRLVRK